MKFNPNNEEWLKTRYFRLGDGRIQNEKIIYANKILKIIKDNFHSEFDCFMFRSFLESGNYQTRGEQVSRILKEFANRGILSQKNTMNGIDGKGAKKARYLYELNKESISQ